LFEKKGKKVVIVLNKLQVPLISALIHCPNFPVNRECTAFVVALIVISAQTGSILLVASLFFV